MNRYIAFLRGINVSGQKLIKMDELKRYFQLPGFENVVAYIQSGNVLFSTNETDVPLLNKLIEDTLQSKLGYKVSIIIRILKDIEGIIANNPFKELMNNDNRKLSVTFLSDFPKDEKITELPIKSGNDELCLIKKEVYILYESYGNSKLSNTFIEKKLGVSATTRNWATLNKIVSM